MAKNNPIIIGISIGDLNGIGPEIVLKSFADLGDNEKAKEMYMMAYAKDSTWT